MMSFRGGRLGEMPLPPATVWLLGDVLEGKGRQALFVKQAPQVLKALRDVALVESAESSNRIEGVTVERARLRPLVLGNARPRDRSEREVQGYRNALNLIHTAADRLPVAPDTLRNFHRLIQEDSGDAGEWKKVDNEIIEVRAGAPPVVRFRPVSVAATPAAIDELCLSYRHAVDQQTVQPLVAAGAFVLDFLCIHPFRDGNGRVARLVSLLALYHHGVEVGRYISLERLIEENREDYYDVLQRSSAGWHEGRHDPIPWLNYFFGIIRRAFREFERRAGDVRSPRGAKRELVRLAVEATTAEFSLTDLERVCPGVSRDMIRLVLRELRAEGTLRCKGRGPGAAWERVRPGEAVPWKKR
jgi:Fic family protein